MLPDSTVLKNSLLGLIYFLNKILVKKRKKEQKWYKIMVMYDKVLMILWKSKKYGLLKKLL